MKWYIVQAYSNFEKKVAESIEREALRKGLSDHFEKILIPSERVVEVRMGKKVNSERRFFPGYILIRVNLTDEVFHLIKNTPKIVGFLGSLTHPVPVPDHEIAAILSKVEDGAVDAKSTIVYEVGEHVRVVDGPFINFDGIVREVDEDRTRLKVEVSIFGRATPVDLDYNQVEKKS